MDEARHSGSQLNTRHSGSRLDKRFKVSESELANVTRIPEMHAPVNIDEINVDADDVIHAARSSYVGRIDETTGTTIPIEKHEVPYILMIPQSINKDDVDAVEPIQDARVPDIDDITGVMIPLEKQKLPNILNKSECEINADAFHVTIPLEQLEVHNLRKKPGAKIPQEGNASEPQEQNSVPVILRKPAIPKVPQPDKQPHVAEAAAALPDRGLPEMVQQFNRRQKMTTFCEYFLDKFR